MQSLRNIAKMPRHRCLTRPVAVALLAGIAAAVVGASHTAIGQDMDHLQTIIDEVAGWDESSSDSGDPILRLHGGLALRAARDDPRYAAWRHATAQPEGPVYVQFDPTTKSLTALYFGRRELVDSLDMSPTRRAIVTFAIRPSFYYVDTDRAGSSELIARLRDALDRRQPVVVISHPSTLEIIDVRPASQ